jgi:type II secretory pathway pseudopilin PulG
MRQFVKTLPTQKPRFNQRGISMLSTLLAVAIGGVFAYIIFTQYQDTTGKSRREASVNEITQIVASAQKLYGGANHYGQVTTAVAVQGGVIPERLRIPGTSTANNRYDGALSIAPVTITSTNDSLALGYPAVNTTDCQDVVLTVEKLMRGITVGGVDVKANDAALNVATLATQCDAGAPVTVGFRFGRQ